MKQKSLSQMNKEKSLKQSNKDSKYQGGAAYRAFLKLFRKHKQEEKRNEKNSNNTNCLIIDKL